MGHHPQDHSAHTGRSTRKLRAIGATPPAPAPGRTGATGVRLKLALVTGAAGHLGLHLVQALVAAGYQVRAGVRRLDDHSRTRRLLALPGVAVVAADVLEPGELRRALAGVDLLCHAAAVVAVVAPQHSDEIVHTAVRGTELALRAAAEAGVRKVVYTSSIVTLPLVAPGEPPVSEDDWARDLGVPYIRAKTESEQLAWRLAGSLKLPMVALLPAALSGPGFARNTPTIDLLQAMADGAFRLGAPWGNYPLVDVRDAARAHVLAAQHDIPGRFIVCQDEQPSFTQLVQLLHEIDGRIGSPLVTLPAALAATLPMMDRLNHLLRRTPRVVTPELVHTTVAGRVWALRNTRARTLLGWRPEVGLRQSLADTLDAIRARQATERDRTALR